MTDRPEGGSLGPTFRSNALGTFVAVDVAQRSGVRRFLCANAFGIFYWCLSGLSTLGQLKAFTATASVVDPS